MRVGEADSHYRPGTKLRIVSRLVQVLLMGNQLKGDPKDMNRAGCKGLDFETKTTRVGIKDRKRVLAGVGNQQR